MRAADAVSTDILERRLAKEGFMLRWALGFFVVALVAALFGFTEIASGAAWVAKFLFFVFLVAFILTALFGVRRRRLLIVRVRNSANPPSK
jgi:uncharacterized membrane protein YtjA (UPF0391 family)